jgi:hypothetical protein
MTASAVLDTNVPRTALPTELNFKYDLEHAIGIHSHKMFKGRNVLQQ